MRGETSSCLCDVKATRWLHSASRGVAMVEARFPWRVRGARHRPKLIVLKSERCDNVVPATERCFLADVAKVRGSCVVGRLFWCASRTTCGSFRDVRQTEPEFNMKTLKVAVWESEAEKTESRFLYTVPTQLRFWGLCGAHGFLSRRLSCPRSSSCRSGFKSCKGEIYHRSILVWTGFFGRLGILGTRLFCMLGTLCTRFFGRLRSHSLVECTLRLWGLRAFVRCRSWPGRGLSQELFSRQGLHGKKSVFSSLFLAICLTLQAEADTLYAAMESHCMSRGLPWDAPLPHFWCGRLPFWICSFTDLRFSGRFCEVKFMQDLATLRCKQNRQAEAAELLEAKIARK